MSKDLQTSLNRLLLGEEDPQSGSAERGTTWRIRDGWRAMSSRIDPDADAPVEVVLPSLIVPHLRNNPAESIPHDSENHHRGSFVPLKRFRLPGKGLSEESRRLYDAISAQYLRKEQFVDKNERSHRIDEKDVTTHSTSTVSTATGSAVSPFTSCFPWNSNDAGCLERDTHPSSPTPVPSFLSTLKRRPPQCVDAVEQPCGTAATLGENESLHLIGTAASMWKSADRPVVRPPAVTSPHTSPFVKVEAQEGMTVSVTEGGGRAALFKSGTRAWNHKSSEGIMYTPQRSDTETQDEDGDEEEKEKEEEEKEKNDKNERHRFSGDDADYHVSLLKKQEKEEEEKRGVTRDEKTIILHQHANRETTFHMFSHRSPTRSPVPATPSQDALSFPATQKEEGEKMGGVRVHPSRSRSHHTGHLNIADNPEEGSNPSVSSSLSSQEVERYFRELNQTALDKQRQRKRGRSAADHEIRSKLAALQYRTFHQVEDDGECVVRQASTADLLAVLQPLSDAGAEKPSKRKRGRGGGRGGQPIGGVAPEATDDEHHNQNHSHRHNAEDVTRSLAGDERMDGGAEEGRKEWRRGMRGRGGGGEEEKGAFPPCGTRRTRYDAAELKDNPIESTRTMDKSGHRASQGPAGAGVRPAPRSYVRSRARRLAQHEKVTAERAAILRSNGLLYEDGDGPHAGIHLAVAVAPVSSPSPSEYSLRMNGDEVGNGHQEGYMTHTPPQFWSIAFPTPPPAAASCLPSLPSRGGALPSDGGHDPSPSPSLPH